MGNENISLATLRARKTNLQNFISDKRFDQTSVNNDISDLNVAINKMNNHISKYETSKSNVNKLTINESKWKGKEKEKFDELYSTYKTKLSSYGDRLEDTKVKMEEARERLKDKLASIQSTIDIQTTNLANLERDIRNKERAQ